MSVLDDFAGKLGETFFRDLVEVVGALFVFMALNGFVMNQD